MDVHSPLLIEVDLFGSLTGSRFRQPHFLQHHDEFDLLRLRMLLECPTLGAHLGVDLLVGRGHGGVFAQRHRESASQQARYTAHHDSAGVGACRHTRDQGGVAHQSVHRTERRGA